MSPVGRAAAAAWISAFALTLSLAGHVQAQFPSQFELSGSVHLDEADSTARAHLERVKAYVADEQWDEAVETLRQVMENYGGKVIELAERRFINVADYCQAQIGSLPAPALELYRQRVDPQAEQWTKEGVAARDSGRLLAVVNQLFCSSWGDDALLALGEIALEQGQYGSARGYWEAIVERPAEKATTEQYEAARTRAGASAALIEQLDHWYAADTADPPVYRLRHDEYLSDKVASALVRLWKAVGMPPSRLAFPETTLELADVRARLVLVSIMEGSLERARGELEAFAHLHPDANGSLGGRQVKYVAELQAMLAQADKWPARPVTDDWPTLAGSAARNRMAPHKLEVGSLVWKQPISLGAPLAADVANAKAFSSRRVAEDAQGLLSYHPVTSGDLLLVHNLSSVMAFNLKTGEPAWGSGKNSEIIFSSELPTQLSTSRFGRGLGVPRFTLTVADNKVYARMGSQVTSRSVDISDNQTGYLVCLDLAAQGRLVWKIDPDDDRWSFEGAPVVAGTDVYVAMRHSDVRPQSFVACLDAQTGRRRWRTLISSAETPGGGQNEEMTHNLLTLHDGTLYMNTNLGAVAAIAARDGRVQWISTYPRARRASSDGHDMRAAHFYRDLNPCIWHQSTLLVAPSDSEAIFALDAQTGQMLWETRLPDDAVHLLGVGGGNLLASGDHLWWIDVAGGKVVSRWPDSTPLGFGKGVLAGDKVYFPTRENIHVFDQHQPRGQSVPVERQRISLSTNRGVTGGNLVVAHGLLLIATADKIFAFEQPAGKSAASPAAPTNSKTATPPNKPAATRTK